KLSKVLLRICKKFNLGKDFLLWSGRFLGRAFAASGEVYPEWTQESFFKDREGLPSNTNRVDLPTNAAILDLVSGLLLSDDKKVVSLAEETLIEIISSEAADAGIHPEHDANASFLLLPRDVYAGLYWKTLPKGTEPIEMEPMSIEAAASFGNLSPDKWMQRFALAVVSNIPQDPIAKRLARLLQNVDGLARQLLPYIIHSFLIDAVDEGEEDQVELSKIVRNCVSKCTPATSQHVSILLKTVIYLRSQKRQSEERTKLERDDWLDLDYLELSKAATI